MRVRLERGGLRRVDRAAGGEHGAEGAGLSDDDAAGAELGFPCGPDDGQSVPVPGEFPGGDAHPFPGEGERFRFGRAGSDGDAAGDRAGQGHDFNFAGFHRVSDEVPGYVQAGRGLVARQVAARFGVDRPVCGCLATERGIHERPLCDAAASAEAVNILLGGVSDRLGERGHGPLVGQGDRGSSPPHVKPSTGCRSLRPGRG